MSYSRAHTCLIAERTHVLQPSAHMSYWLSQYFQTFLTISVCSLPPVAGGVPINDIPSLEGKHKRVCARERYICRYTCIHISVDDHRDWQQGMPINDISSLEGGHSHVCMPACESLQMACLIFVWFSRYTCMFIDSSGAYVYMHVYTRGLGNAICENQYDACVQLWKLYSMYVYMYAYTLLSAVSCSSGLQSRRHQVCFGKWCTWSHGIQGRWNCWFASHPGIYFW